MARNQSVVYRAGKRAFDIVFSGVVTIVAAIPMAIVCVAVRAESEGSPIFSQERMGKDGKTIHVLKVRSMYSDAEDVEKYLTEEQLAVWHRERKIDDDPRITRVGARLRNLSVDEVPQFLNVLTGDLSVIGPRPITREELEQHFTPEERRELLSMRPGITGLWQSTERNDATFETGRRQEIELSYVRNAGFALDAKCFFGTFGAMFGKNRSGK